MTTTALSIPIDIPWRRLAFSADMIDRRIDTMYVPPRWRPSMTVYHHVVPEAQTAATYPDARVIYLKLSASMTGWSPADYLDDAVKLEEARGIDDWQRSAWEVLLGSGWVGRYAPCVGAIAQVAVYPRPQDETPLHDYPYFVDFEPKKRELYETRTESGEVLSGSSHHVNVQKGTTSTETTEKSEIVNGGSFRVPGLEVGASGEWGTRKSNSAQTVDLRNTDTMAERRETVSHSTQLSQMYQLFTSYHPGTNRAVFVILPRPHIVTSAEQAEFNLINGPRLLEGVQEVFLVVHVPRSIPGICVQAWLDTGHRIEPSYRAPTVLVTRRLIAACGALEGDQLVSSPAPPERLVPPIVGELPIRPPDALAGDTARARVLGGRAARVAVADALNHAQVQLREGLLSLASSRRYRPRDLVETQLFDTLVREALSEHAFDLDQLARLGYLTADETARLRRAGITSSAHLFDSDPERARRRARADVDVDAIARRLLDAMRRVTSRPGSAQATEQQP